MSMVVGHNILWFFCEKFTMIDLQCFVKSF